eukprot:9650835-Lingulodinium_polyedra.AAC.1
MFGGPPGGRPSGGPNGGSPPGDDGSAFSRPSRRGLILPELRQSLPPRGRIAQVCQRCGSVIPTES